MENKLNIVCPMCGRVLKRISRVPSSVIGEDDNVDYYRGECECGYNVEVADQRNAPSEEREKTVIILILG